MADSGRRGIEILVHVSAPSRGQDDARYRALARAYLSFEPTARDILGDKSDRDSDEDVNTQANSQHQEEFDLSILQERESAASYRPDDEQRTDSVTWSNLSVHQKESGLVSPVLSFSSALDNADSPTWRDLRNAALPNGLRSLQQVSQASVEIADSQPEATKTIPAYSSPTRILELYLQQSQCSGKRSSSSHEIERHDPRTPSSAQSLPYGGRRTQSGDSKRVGELSSISCTPSSPSPQKRRQHNFQPVSKHGKGNIPSTQDPTILVKRKWLDTNLEDSHISSSAPSKLSIASSTVVSRRTRSRKRQLTDGSVDEVTKSREVTSSRVILITASSAPSVDAKSSWADKLEIHPSPPRTSTEDLTSNMLITSSLQQLAQKMPLATFFRPKAQTRDLQPMERGHWSFKYSSWDPCVRERCWECLGRFIGRGLVGWGVWCVRNEDLDVIRVYCWGIVAGHVYLLLHMASGSKIKKAGATWIGGDGVAVITMPG